MAFALAPPWLQLPSQFWAVLLFAVGAIFAVRAAIFLVRATIWGQKLPFGEWWWDPSHVVMSWGMALMFVNWLQPGYVSVPLALYWLWLASYNFKYLLTETQPLHIGSNFAHVAMGLAMFTMWYDPMLLMPPGASMPGMICLTR
jgi:hypothetical protein